MKQSPNELARDARFEPFDGHRSLVLRWQPAVPVRAQALFFPPFGDEMNQSRRMVRLAAEALAVRGIAACVFDLHGTGDSSADFCEATVAAWLADCEQMIEWRLAEVDAPLLLIGCRLGVALAAQASHRLEKPAAALIGWAPLLQGRQQLSGLLRLDKMARMSRPQAASAEPRTLWSAGEFAVLGGYPVSPVLAAQLEDFDASDAPRAERAVLFDLRLPAGEGTSVGPSEALRKRAAAWSEHGVPTEAVAVPGAAFWNVADLVDVPELIESTTCAVEAALQALDAQMAGPGPAAPETLR